MNCDDSQMSPKEFAGWSDDWWLICAYVGGNIAQKLSGINAVFMYAITRQKGCTVRALLDNKSCIPDCH